VEALKQSWHVKCFVCTMCSKPFGNNKFINVDSKPYCEQCGRKAFVSGRMQRRNSTADLKKAAETPAEPEDETPPTPTPAPTPAKAKGSSPLINSGGQVPVVAGAGSAMTRSQSVTFQKPAQVVHESTKDAESLRPKLAATGGGMADRLAAFQKKPDETAKPATSPSGPARDSTRAKSAIFEKKPESDDAKKKLEAKKKEEEELERIREEKKKQRLAEEEKRKKEKEQEENYRKEQEAQEKAKREEARKKREEERKKKEEEEEAAEQAKQAERKKK